MLERLVSILFPVFAIAALGYFVARKHKPDLAHANRLNTDVFTPALVFSALASKSFDFHSHRWLALAMLFVIALSGVAGWLLSKPARLDARTLMATLMYGNTANLGFPLAVLSFGEPALHSAVVLFVASMVVQFSFGAWLLDRSVQLHQVWRSPLILSALAGLAISLLGIPLWSPFYTAIKMVGDIAIPLMLFALGARLTEVRSNAFRSGLLAGAMRPMVCMLIAWLVALALSLDKQDAQILLLYGALPPGVLNFILSERYGHEPERMASIVLVGNLLTLVSMPIALWIVL